jgi:carboxyl-terminal processing protease
VRFRPLFLAPLLAILLLAVGSLAQPPSLLADETRLFEPVSLQVSTTPGAAPIAAPGLDSLKQGYDLLLDRYVQAVSPADLLAAGYDAVVKGLQDAGVTVKNPGSLQLEPDREKAYATFTAKLASLLKESPPPADFNPTAVALAAMAKSVNEGHTSYMTAAQYKEFVAYLRGDVRYGGIGVRPKRPDVTIMEVFPDSPAERAGLTPGDVIRKVDGQATADKTLEEVAQLIRGPEGSTVSLEVDRPRTGEHLSLQVVRASIKVDYISTDMVQNNIGYIRLRGFPEPSVADRFEQFLDKLPSMNPRGLVIDLRGNSGGRIDVGLRLLNRFISSGPLFDQVDRSGTHRIQVATGPGWSNPVPVAILIDEGTASMGEIFASAMQEHGLARLFGNRTSGNVAAAQVYPLSDGSAMQVTILEIYSGKGAPLNRIGVAPDVFLASSPAEIEGGRDIPLEAAVLYCWSASDQQRPTTGQSP